MFFVPVFWHSPAAGSLSLDISCWGRHFAGTEANGSADVNIFYMFHMFRSQDLTKRRTIDPSNFTIFVVDEETKLALLSEIICSTKDLPAKSDCLVLPWFILLLVQRD